MKIITIVLLALMLVAFKQKDLPNVLIIGDSISIGYTPFVKAALKEKANVSHNLGNAKHTGNGLEKLDDWLGETKWDVIHFNWGLWDLCYRNPDSQVQGGRDKKNGILTFTIEQYKRNLEKLVSRLKLTGAQLIFATTTHVPDGEAGRIANDDKRYNKVAIEIMKRHGVKINHLNELSEGIHGEYAIGNGDVHYTPEGYKLLANPVTNMIVQCLQSESKKDKKKPNIVFILADDLGYSDVGYMSQKIRINTPNINQLASNGMIFTNAYAASPVCSPTRASILTGKYPSTLNLTCHIPGMGMEQYVTKQSKGKKLMEASFIDRLPLEELTFAEVLKEHGYSTAFMGKWHLAGEGSAKTDDGIVDPRFHPEKQGFDINIAGCAYGQPANYFSPYKNGTIIDGPEQEYLTDRLAMEACQFIEQNKERPFLLYLSTYTVHTPLQAPEQTINKNKGNKYFAMIEKLDENVGKVLTKIKALDLDNNTLVIFYSDNGGVYGNSPLRANKGSLFEGGIRVPLLFSLPGKILPGTRNDVAVTSPDLFPTLLEAVGISHGRYKDLEGVSLWPLLTQKQKNIDRAIYWHFPHHREMEKSMGAAIRIGDWKLIWEFESEELSLFNLKEDISEAVNLKDKHPNKVKNMYSKLKKWQQETQVEMPNPNPEYENE
ncbi:sulfatase-like hydrolase/transferase [Seonamhaeicola sp.]|uniref:sulfatase-like hydrolase/transferase n=1 Tax=Seonamhaeicola sp. TaxID=1912245 RepID=UPI00260EAA70|nr:sulfatase-like hydrolase/transferase [Seonamhaeicola sp.]